MRRAVCLYGELAYYRLIDPGPFALRDPQADIQAQSQQKDKAACKRYFHKTHLNRKDFKQFGPACQYEPVSSHTQESLNNSQRDLSRHKRNKHGQEKFTQWSITV